MSALGQALDEYLSIRRSVGHRLVLTGYVLANFVSYMDARGSETVTTEAALAWAVSPSGTQPNWWAQRLAMVRGFARFLHALNDSHEVPPEGLLETTARRGIRHMFTSDDIVALMVATRSLTPKLRAVTYETVIGLLAATGMRVGEALSLDIDDVDLSTGVLKIRHAKFDKHRLVPVHDTTVAALGAYGLLRDGLVETASCASFFVSPAGDRLGYRQVLATFVHLLGVAGFEDRSKIRPRIHDLRHAFATSTLAGWHESGADVERLLPRLSTYLGHVDPKTTYWYLSATPELMEKAGLRLEQSMGDLS